MGVLPGFNIIFRHVYNQNGVPYGIHPEKLDRFDLLFTEMMGMSVMEAFDSKKVL